MQHARKSFDGAQTLTKQWQKELGEKKQHEKRLDYNYL